MISLGGLKDVSAQSAALAVVRVTTRLQRGFFCTQKKRIGGCGTSNIALVVPYGPTGQARRSLSR